MALTATMHQVKLVVNDVDRGVYDTFELRVARHPSETLRYMFTRILAYGLSWEEGLTFSKAGIADTEDPALSVFDLTGVRRAWIEVGQPAADRLHKASKATERVAIFTWVELAALRKEAATRPIHRLDGIEVWRIEPALLTSLEAVVDRKFELEVLRNGEQLYVTSGNRTFEGTIERAGLAERG
jgi:uncharacterized protein YaeQ